jgi:D-arabinose 1-dehydrogenase-like Zn-dependent alcohol dehydrogenase
MMYEETDAVYCENPTQHTDTLCGQYAEFCYVKAAAPFKLQDKI